MNEPAVAAASETLYALLEQHITLAPDEPINGVPVDLRSPADLRDVGVELAVSLWLYHAAPAMPALAMPAASRAQATGPLVDLFYLVTPLAPEPLVAHALLARAMAVFHAHPLLAGTDLRGALVGTGTALRITPQGLSPEQAALLWQALGQPPGPAASYQVSFVQGEAGPEPGASRQLPL